MNKEAKKSPKTKKQKILSRILSAFLILVFALLLYIILMLLMGKPVYFFGHTMVRIQTESMYIEGDSSSIAPGDFLIIKKIKPSGVKENDIITFYSDDPAISGKMNTHRVLSVITSADGGLEFVTKGDNNPIQDYYTAKDENIVGIYTGEKVGLFKSIFKLFSNKAFFVLLIFIPAVIIMSFTTRDLLRSFKVKEPEEVPAPPTAEELVAIEVERLKREGLPEDFDKKSDSDENNLKK